MPVNPGLATTIQAGVPYYRITSIAHLTRSARLHKNVVNGQGCFRNTDGGRYNESCTVTVYMTEVPKTCFAEQMFYFHREVLSKLDFAHKNRLSLPAFQNKVILWEVLFQNAIPNALELTTANASAVNVFPCLMLNPSQDYEHLKERRKHIQCGGYSGLIAPSTRCRSAPPGNLVVVFSDQSKNVQQITPFECDIRLITKSGGAFINHATDDLDFTAGEVKLTGSPLPTSLQVYSSWQHIPFNH